MNLTEDQRYFMDILETAGFVRTGQVLPLLRINEPRKELNYAEAMLRRLRRREKPRLCRRMALRMKTHPTPIRWTRNPAPLGRTLW